ncbi:putative long-chain-fatty-acid--CoA ligase FadD23 [Lacipirellula limnantheis]|uniref:Putative long-chain-fatty-acid--CoA ligase FadD23 n=2 Tax=Lacipirellula limnantheis TaxID=2528024 RepID=A0A517U5G8_9BACT|nr:putative long-chain-fatty-acid--CoA ligase FadD23 [Lacipirellula limnantheis]
MRPATHMLPTSNTFRFRYDIFSLLRSVMPAEAPTPQSELRSVAELLRRRAAERPLQAAFVFVPESAAADGRGELSWTYAELDRRARAVAAEVSRVAAPGERAVLVFPPGLEFIAAFFGCLYAGVLPAPATYPKPRRPSSRLDAIVADCKPLVALTTSETLGMMQLDEQSASVRALEWIAVDRCRDEDAFADPVQRAAGDAAFLQYTSGSTSQPRGVVVTHGNLLHNLELIRSGFCLKRADESFPPVAGVFWLPAYHDMGLIGGILTPLFVGGTSYLLAPATFLQRPSAWLETISRTGAAISGAPNFAYELCARKISPEQRAALDLSRWKLAFCGAEPIDARALDDFAAAFGDRGFNKSAFFPCYGLAEATLMVSGCSRAEGPRVFQADRAALGRHRLAAAASATNVQTLVSCGKPLGDQEVRVVDPHTFEPCGDGQIGEIWIAGGSVAKGYWNHPEELWQTFGGRLADGSGPFLRTGDLGAFDAGELFVTGRAKDVIIIRGRNLYPQDIERTVQQAHEAVDLGAAFSWEVDGHEQLVVVHQIAREHRRNDMTPVLRAIRAAIVEEHDVDPYQIVLLRPGGLPLTSSGKVQRSRCRDLLVANGLEQLASWMQSTSAGAPTIDPLAETEPFNGAAQGRGARHGAEFLNHVGTMAPEQLAQEIQSWMLEWLEERVEPGCGVMSPIVPFTELGMDSLTALELNVDFEKVLGVRLPPAAAWSYPTPAELSRFLADSMLGVAVLGEPSGNGVDSWFAAMEADARRK